MFIVQNTFYLHPKKQANIIETLEDALQGATTIDDNKSINSCICNIGILKGKQSLQEYQDSIKNNFENEDENDEM